jgi:hypothetical protein
MSSTTDGYPDGCTLHRDGKMRTFDKLPEPIRQKLAESPFNWCATCFYEYYRSVCNDVQATLAEISRAEKREKQAKRKPSPVRPLKS